MTDRERLIAVYDAAMTSPGSPDHLRLALDAAKAISALPKGDDDKPTIGFKAAP